MQAAITDAARAGVQVYSIFWGSGHSSAGQNHLSTLSQATGGEVFGIATQGGSSSFTPYFEQVLKQSQNQLLVQLTVAIKFKPKDDVQPLELKTDGYQGRVVAPKQALLGNAAALTK